MGTVIVDHKKLRKQGIACLVETVVITGFLFHYRDLFVDSMAKWLLPFVVISMLLCTVYFFLASRNEDHLDAEGVTTRSVFRTKTYLWADVRKFEILWQWQQKKFFAMRKEKTPYIRLVFAKPWKEFIFPYREDILLCIRQCHGEPDMDKWSEENK